MKTPRTSKDRQQAKPRSRGNRQPDTTLIADVSHGWPRSWTYGHHVDDEHNPNIRLAPRYIFYSERRVAEIRKTLQRIRHFSDLQMYQAFCITRLGLLGHPNILQLLMVEYRVHGHMRMPSPGHIRVTGWQSLDDSNFSIKNSRWTPEDIDLISATCNFLLRSVPTSRTKAVEELKFLSESNDPLIQAESSILLLRLYLENLQHRKTPSIDSVVVKGVPIIFEVTRSPKTFPDNMEQLMSTVVSASQSLRTTVSHGRLKRAQAAMTRESFHEALLLLDCSKRAESLTSGSDVDVEEVENSVIEIEAFIRSSMSKAWKSTQRQSALKTKVRRVQAMQLTPEQELRLVDALIRLGLHKATAADWHHTVEHLLHDFCSDATLDKHSWALVSRLAAFHEHLAVEKVHGSAPYHAHYAWYYASAAKDKALAQNLNVPESLIRCLRTARLYSSAASVLLPILEMLDQLDEAVPPGSPLRREIPGALGMALSGGPVELDSIDLTERLKNYWLENLTYARQDFERFGDANDLAWALREAAVAHRIHSVRSTNDDEVLENLRYSLELATEAEELYESPRASLIRSFVLHEYSTLSNDMEGVQQAINLQTSALNRWFGDDDRERYRLTKGKRDSASALDVTFVVSPEDDREAFEAYQRYLRKELKSSSKGLLTLASHASHSAKLAFKVGDYQFCAQAASSIIPHVTGPMAASTIPYQALQFVQGLAALGAAAYIESGEYGLAVGLLELGTTLRIRSAHGTIQQVEQAINHCRDTVLRLSLRLDDPIVYLAATEDYGFALIVRAGNVEVVPLPDLARNNVLDLLGALSANKEADQDVVTRGPRGSSAPSRASVETLILSARQPTQPLRDALASADVAHLIPVGATAGLPWGHILDHAVTTTPSGTLLHVAYNGKASGHHGRTVIANPHPIRHKDLDYANLPGAEEEAITLHHDWDFDPPITGKNATRAAYNNALNQGLKILHLATHAEINELSWGDEADILWTTNTAEGTSETTPVQEPLKGTFPPAAVFLAACSGATPNRTLPDEAISFPTTLLSGGVNTVIAPLWPISDTATYDLVTNFYENLDNGMTPAHALRNAANHLRETDRRHAATYSAFIVTGADSIP